MSFYDEDLACVLSISSPHKKGKEQTDNKLVKNAQNAYKH